MLKNLIPFMEQNDGTNVGGAEPTQGNQDTPKGADEPKTGEDIKSEAQKLADGMFAKRMKGISKEDIESYKANKADFEAYLNEKKTEAERVAEAKKNAEKIASEAKAKEIKADAMIKAVKEGIKPEYIEDAVILAMAKANDDVSLDDAIHTVAENNSAWKVGANLGDKGGNPPEDNEKNTEIKTFI